VDNTIVMLENITRHQQTDNDNEHAATEAAAEVTSAVTASTSTNLAAVLPFLFIGGLTGLMFSELIVTLSASIVASLIVALTLVPALGARTRGRADNHSIIDRPLQSLRDFYANALNHFLKHPVWIFAIAIPLLIISAYTLLNGKELFFPEMDEGRISISITGEPGTRLEEMDHAVTRMEDYFLNDPNVESVYLLTGGSVFGRSQYERSNRANITVQLKGLGQRELGSKAWVKHADKAIDDMQLTGLKIRMRVRSGLRGVRTSSGDDDISLRILGPDINVLSEAGEKVVEKLKGMPGVDNLEQSYEEQIEELVLNIDRQRAADLGITTDVIGESLAIALDGKIISDYLEGDRQFDIRLRTDKQLTQTIPDIEQVIVAVIDGKIIRLRDVARLDIRPAPSSIKRDNQRRIVEISGSLKDGAGLKETVERAFERLSDLQLPEGYSLYDGGSLDAIRESQQVGYTLLGLALFLVFVVMAVQYESLQNPMIIMLAVPFTLIGVALGMELVLQNQLTMPAKIGLIMLAGIVVNNAIVLVEQIEIQRERGDSLAQAIRTAAALRLRPILMTTLTTVVGMLPLAIGLGEGSEMLQPMATVIVFGLLFAMVVSLFLVPLLYQLTHREKTGD
jgi:multidrug efflux pump subunit AcrB